MWKVEKWRNEEREEGRKGEREGTFIGGTFIVVLVSPCRCRCVVVSVSASQC
jgi:hypothetical protein